MRRVLALAMVWAVALFGVAPAESATFEVDLSDEGSVFMLEVAPTGDVYVSTSTHVIVFDPDGVRLETFEISGVQGMAWHDGAMWISSYVDRTVYEIESPVPAIGRSYTFTQLGASIASGDGLLYVMADFNISSLDPADGTLVDLEIVGGHPWIKTSPAYPGELFLASASSNTSIQRWDVSAVPATQVAVTASSTIGNFLDDWDFDDAGTSIYLANWGAPYPFRVVDAATMALSGTYPAVASPYAVDVTAGRFAAATGPGQTDNVELYDVGDPTPIATWSVDTVTERGIGLSPDGSRVYVLTEAGFEQGSLNILTLTPFAPVVITALPGDGEADVWFAPVGEDDITSFTVTASPGGQTCTGPAPMCTVTGLSNGVSHTFTVVATNAYGDSVPSDPSPAVVPAAAAAPPVGPNLAADGQVTWSPSAGTTSYEVSYREYDITGEWLAPQIVGGSNVPYDPHRHIVKLLAADNGDLVFECDGVLIDDEWVLTAAHCLEYDNGARVPDYFAVLYGNAYWPDGIDDLATFRRFGDDFWKHPAYDSAGLANDIGLIRLDEPIDRRYADPIPIGDFFDPADGSDAYVTGWGRTSTNGLPADDLQGLAVTIDTSCGDWATTLGPYFSPEGMVCTDTAPRGTCSGDSGGPLVINESGVLVLAGIVSFGSAVGCGVDSTLPDAYTRVANYIDWIEGYTGSLWQTAGSTGGTSVVLPDLGSGRSYLVAVTAVTASGRATSFATGTIEGQKILSVGELGVDCSTGQPHPFVDVAVSSWAYDPIGCIFNLGVTTGTSPSTYAPADDVTRDQMGAFLGRFYETLTGESCGGSHPFSDVAASSWANAPVACIYSLGITTGTSATTYSPGQRVTREQMGSFMARMYRTITGKDCGSPAPFVDVPTSSFAYHDIGCIFSLGITTGTSDTTYSPGQYVTRAQMAAFIERLYNLLT